MTPTAGGVTAATAESREEAKRKSLPEWWPFVLIAILAMAPLFVPQGLMPRPAYLLYFPALAIVTVVVGAKLAIDAFRAGLTARYNAKLTKQLEEMEDWGRFEQGHEDPNGTVRESLAKEPDNTIARKALTTLTKQERAIIILSEYEGMSYREIADCLGVPKGTVMSRLHLARRKLSEATLREATSRFERR